MRIGPAWMVSVGVALGVTACGARPSAGTVEADEASTTESAHASEGSDEVAARLAPLPPPPVAWDTPVAQLSDQDFEGICPYLAENAGLSRPEVTCPDGSLVETYDYHCDPSTSGPSARSMPCAITFGEILACYLALREHPCDGGATGETLPECAAFEACGVDLPGERRVKARLAAGAFMASLAVASVALANVDFAVTDVATIFYVDKSDDRNRVDYGIRLDASCLPTSGSPMVVYWREFERGSGGRVTHGLNIFEGPVYGVGSQQITERRADGATLDVTVRALSSRRLTVRTGPAAGGGCTASATTTIGGARAVLDHVHLTLGDGPGSLRFADIYGTAVAGGPVTEHIVH